MKLQFEQVSLAFGDRDILKNVSVNMQTGTKAALTGANGAGKSTLIKVTGKKLSELAAEMTIFPQELVNVRVTDKHAVTENNNVAAVIAQVEQEMNGDGRVLVRPSGTEPLVRVMVEAATEQACKEYVTRIEINPTWSMYV